MSNKIGAVLSLVVAIAGGFVCSGSGALAATTRTWINSEQVSNRYCVRHRHGDYWHSCSDTRHPVFDQSHSHTGLPAYYVSAGQQQSNGFYFGVKSGSMNVGIEQSDVGMPKGFVMGFGWIEYALEFEASTTSISVAPVELTRPGELSGFDSSYSTTALYGVRRIGDSIYTKMKVGLSRSRYELDGQKQRDSNASAGIGFGVRIGTILLEGEYTYVGSRAKFLSIGANIVF